MYYIYDDITEIENDQELIQVIQNKDGKFNFIVKDKTESSKSKIEQEWDQLFEKYFVSAPLKYSLNVDAYRIIKAFSLHDLIEKVKILIDSKGYRILSNYKIVKKGKVKVYLVEIGLVNEKFLNII